MHHMTVKLTKNQILILGHTVNRAVGGYFCGESLNMLKLTKLGLMEPAGKKACCDDKFYKITAWGKQRLNAEVQKQKGKN